MQRVSGSGEAWHPTWAPDGRRLAFLRRAADGGGARLWVAEILSGALQELTGGARQVTSPASWTPDSSAVVYTEGQRIIRHDVTRHVRDSFPVDDDLGRPSAPAVSPDGRLVVFQVDGSGSWLLDLADGTTRRLLANTSADRFAWGPDGRSLALRGGSDDDWRLVVLAGRESPGS